MRTLPGDPCRLAGALAAPELRGARAGALVLRARDGARVFARDPEVPLTPASNLKILTALAALLRFGPDHRFVTEVRADALPDEDGRIATLYLRGSGDPALVSEQWWRLAADLRRDGARRIGRLQLDDAAFDRELWHPSWTPVGARAYEAPVAALQANYGTFQVVVRPGLHAGAPVRVALDPSVPGLTAIVRAVTVAPTIPASLTVSRESGPQGEAVIVAGLLPADAGPQWLGRSVADPTRYTGSVLTASLAANGVALDDPTPIAGATPPGAVLVLPFEGPPLGETVRLMLEHSSNPIAEGLLKALGRALTGEPGSFSSGVRALREILAGVGVDLTGVEIVDGSGLSPRDRASPQALVSALQIARASFAVGPELLAALPVAARDGTLARRAEGAAGRVRAKTGSLTGVAALSGFALSADGEELVFSLLVNGARSNAQAGVDGFARALATCEGVRAAD